MFSLTRFLTRQVGSEGAQPLHHFQHETNAVKVLPCSARSAGLSGVDAAELFARDELTFQETDG